MSSGSIILPEPVVPHARWPSTGPAITTPISCSILTFSRTAGWFHILEFMAGQGYEFLPKPYHVAKMLQEGGLWVFPMNAEPRSPQSDDEEQDLDFEELEFLDDAEEDL